MAGGIDFNILPPEFHEILSLFPSRLLKEHRRKASVFLPKVMIVTAHYTASHL
jgi:hypothetical protein